MGRKNFFFNKEGENTNVHTVVFKASVPTSSAGWTNHEFFQSLGHERHEIGSAERNAEQEYLMQGMVKGAMVDAAQIADRFGVGISVRPTGVLAHMGIESGDPTKAQEYKNKTSKEVDLFLCDELQWKDIGAVVHYDPRVGWKSELAKVRPPVRPELVPKATDSDWLMKQDHIQKKRMPSLEKQFKSKMKFWPTNDSHWAELKKVFLDRAKEYAEEDYDYRKGHYAAYTELVGPYIRLKLRSDINMVGDHDLFGFTQKGYGQLVLDTTLTSVQVALQESQAFQAQHGGIWNWRPSGDFNQGIKTKIMGAHSAPNGDPLIYILPGKKVHAVFFDAKSNTLQTVWDHPTAKTWLASTYSGRSL